MFIILIQIGFSVNSIITLEGISELECPVDRLRTLLDMSDVRDLVGEEDLGYVRVPTFIVLSAWLSVKPRLPTYLPKQMTTDKRLLTCKADKSIISKLSLSHIVQCQHYAVNAYCNISPSLTASSTIKITINTT